ncbi:MAG: hypothetical protein KF746_11080 [Chitinophagaceae bacterium]|nr:hypothetical protein [Chitinophagaceae bacterium]
MKPLLLTCVILFNTCHVQAQYPFRYIIVDSAYGMRYYGIGSDSAIREQYKRDSIKMFHSQQWRDSLERMRPDRRRYYMYVSPFDGDSTQYKRSLEKYLKDSADFYHRQHRRDSLRRVNDSLKNTIYGPPHIAYTPHLPQKLKQLLVRCCFVKPDELS